MLRFSKNHEFLESVANREDVFYKIALFGQDYINLGSIWKQCLGIECDEGGFLLHCIEDGAYEVHTIFPPMSKAFSYAKEAMHMAFCGTDCVDLYTRVPVSNTQALKLTEKTGWNYRYSIKDGWYGKDGKCDTNHYQIQLFSWIVANKELISNGQEFHQRLINSGHELDHEDDPVHDAFVGYVVACAEQDNLSKGVRQYNKWALLSGYATVFIVNGGVRFGNVTAYRDRIEVN